ncbi:hypothetical protein DL768_003346 [Monosporascus sp. mg162]|nr:hypothetical protein DL768_003346 [Monosporascus sp. mg162]
MATEHDIAVIGDGPAGLSAAASIARQAHKTVVLGSGKCRNVESTHMYTMPASDHHDPEEFRTRPGPNPGGTAPSAVENIEIESVRQREEDDFFEDTAGRRKDVDGGEAHPGTGVGDVFPDIPGYERGAASADMLAEDDTGAVAPALHFARQTLRMADEVTLYTSGNEQLASELIDDLDASPPPMRVDPRKIT